MCIGVPAAHGTCPFTPFLYILHDSPVPIILCCGAHTNRMLTCPHQSDVVPFPPCSGLLNESKNFIPMTEVGVLTSMLTAMDVQLLEKGVAAGSPGRMAVLATDEMYIEGDLVYNATQNMLIGGSQISSDEVLMSAELDRELTHKMEKLTGGDEDGRNRAAPKLATRYSAWYVNLLGKDKVSFPVARYATGEINAGVMMLMLEEVIIALLEHNFEVITVVMDGAGNNRSFATSLCTINAVDLIGGSLASLKESFPSVDFDFLLAMAHPVYGKSRPIFFIFDPPHWLKKIRNALRSSNPLRGQEYDERGLPKVDARKVLAPRDLKWPKAGWKVGAPFKENYHAGNLRMIQRGCGLLAGQAPHQHQLTRSTLRRSNFELDRSSVMNVGIASKAFGNKAQSLIAEAGKGGSLTHCTTRLPAFSEYGGIVELMINMNSLWDIVNTSVKNGRRAINSPYDPQLTELMKGLEYFSSWKADIDACTDLSAGEKAASFLPPETWTETRGILLGLYLLSKRYVQDDAQDGDARSGSTGMLTHLIFRRISQDMLENHFGNIRFFSQVQTVETCMRGTAHAAACRASQVMVGGESSRKRRNCQQEVDTNDHQLPWTRKRLSKKQKIMHAKTTADLGLPPCACSACS